VRRSIRPTVLALAVVPGGTEVVGTLSPIRVLSTAIKAYAPDIAFTPDGSFLVAWHEEQFPFLKTVVQPVLLPKTR